MPAFLDFLRTTLLEPAGRSVRVFYARRLRPCLSATFWQGKARQGYGFARELARVLRTVQVPTLVGAVIARMREQRMAQAASSLTFTTLLSLVPLVTLALALFSTFPAFDQLRRALEDYFIESLMPKPVASTVTQYLTLFAGKAKGLSLMGAAFLLMSALALFASVERTLNGLWQAPTPNLLSRRWLIYLAAVLFAPFLVGVGFFLVVQLFASLSGIGHSIGAGKALGTINQFSLQWLPVVLATSLWAAVFKTMPNTTVRWSHAWIGAVLSSVLLWILKYLFVAYILKFGNFKQLYGAFSVIPVFLLWMYLGWLVTLFGATVSAVLPSVSKLEALPADAASDAAQQPAADDSLGGSAAVAKPALPAPPQAAPPQAAPLTASD
jgi:membrane protein